MHDLDLPKLRTRLEYATALERNDLEAIQRTGQALHSAVKVSELDENIAGEFLAQYGLYEMYKRFVKNENVPGIPNINELNYRITHFINENSAQNGTTIFITHDMLIVFYHFSINKKVYTKDNWVNYLTGLTFKNGKIDEE